MLTVLEFIFLPLVLKENVKPFTKLGMRDCRHENQAITWLTRLMRSDLPHPHPALLIHNQSQPKLKYFCIWIQRGKMEEKNVPGTVLMAAAFPTPDGNSISSSLKLKDIFCIVAHAQKYFPSYVFCWVA